MSLQNICKENQDALLSSWLNDFFNHHKLDAIGVSRTISDKFLNPVAYTIKASTTALLPAIIGEDVDPQEIQSQLEEILKIQAIQQLSPAQALLPIFSIKAHIKKLATDPTLLEEYIDMASRVDTLILMAFDLFSQEKEKIYRIRVNELKSAQSQILRFAQSKE